MKSSFAEELLGRLLTVGWQRGFGASFGWTIMQSCRITGYCII